MGLGIVEMGRKNLTRSWLARCQIVAVAIGAATNCSAPPLLPFPDETPFDPVVGTDNPTISIYVDGTESMRGFVNPLPDFETTYQKVLPTAVDDAIQQIWPSAEPSYFKFGSLVRRLEPNDRGVVLEWLQVREPRFYTEELVLYNTYIEQAIDATPTPSLRIIVTDLYQANAEVTTLLTSFSEQSFDSDKTIGITAVRSEFQGRVFTEAVGSGQTYFYSSYRPSCDAECMRPFMRPFYVISIGLHGDVAAFQEAIKDRVETRVPQLYQLHVTSDRTDGLASLKNSRVAASNQILELVENRSLVSATPGGERTFREFLRHNGEVQITLELDSRVTEENWITANGLEPVTTLSVEQWNATAGSFSSVNPAGATVALDAEMNQLAIAIPNGALNAADAIYLVTVDVAVDEQALEFDELVRAWSLESGARGADQVGPKTMNLDRLIDGLWSALRARAIPQLAKFRLYLHVS